MEWGTDLKLNDSGFAKRGYKRVNTLYVSRDNDLSWSVNIGNLRDTRSYLIGGGFNIT